MPTKSLFEQEAPKLEPRSVRPNEVFENLSNVEFALNDRELAETEVFEKRVFEQVTPIKRTK